MGLQDEIRGTQVVVFAGGAGLRLGDSIAKSLLRIEEKTLMERCIELFQNSGFEQFAFILGHRAKEVRAHVDSLSCRGTFHVELFDAGKGKALQNALEAGVVDAHHRAIVVFPDDIFLMPDLPSFVLSHHLFASFKHGATSSVALAPGWEWPYGAASLSESGMVLEFLEKPFVEKLTSTGFYIFEPAVLDTVKRNRKEYLDMEREILYSLAMKRQLNGVVLPAGAWMPVNTQADYRRATRVLTGAQVQSKVPAPWPEERP